MGKTNQLQFELAMQTPEPLAPLRLLSLPEKWVPPGELQPDLLCHGPLLGDGVPPGTLKCNGADFRPGWDVLLGQPGWLRKL